MKIFILIILGIHGLIHIMGFVKAFDLADINQLKQPITKLSGIFWLLASALFIICLVLWLLNIENWWAFAVLGIIISQILIFQSWTDAKYGTIANLIILIPVIISFMNILPSSFQNVYKAEVQNRLATVREETILTENDIQHLPAPVQKYLRYVGAIGKPKVHNIRLVSKGDMRRSVKSDWMEINSRQYNFFDKHARFFYIKSAMFGIPFDGLHVYSGKSATMQIKVASLFQVADAKGDKMIQSENVTLFNDICLLAPPAMIDKNIQWQPIDSLTVKGKFTNNNIMITALIYFNEKGELVNFVSDDRYLSADGKTYTKYRWSTPAKDYKDFNGRKVTTYGEAIWHMPEGEFSYARYNLLDIEYNCKDFK